MFSNQFRLGKRVYFTYTAPTANDRKPMIILLTPNYLGYMHGLKLSEMTTQEQQLIQWLLSSWDQQQNQTNMIQKVQQDFQKKVADYQQKKQEMLQKQTGVIVKADPMTTNKTFGVKTFGPTQKIQQPVAPNNQAQQNVPVEPGQYPDVDEHLAQNINNYLQKVPNPNMIPKEPYPFYHQVIKPLFGSRRIPNFYRKYDLRFVVSPRLF